MAVEPPAGAPTQQDEHRLALIGEKAAVRDLTVRPGWPVLTAGHVEELMRVIESADSTNVTALAVALGEAKGIVRTLRLYRRAAAAPLDRTSTKPENPKRPR